MQQNIDGVEINIPVSGWYSGNSTSLSWFITVRVEVQITQPLICNVHIYTSNRLFSFNIVLYHIYVYQYTLLLVYGQ